MKLTSGILGIGLLLSGSGARVMAQTDAAPTGASTAKAGTAPTCDRLLYTVTEMDGEKRIGTQHFAMTVDMTVDPNTGSSELKLGSRVPIITGSSNPDSPAQMQVQYQDVGLHIAVRLREFPTGVEIFSKVEQSSISEEQSTVGRNYPVIRQAALSNNALLTPGKPVMLGSLDVPGSTRHLDIEVVLEIVR